MVRDFPNPDLKPVLPGERAPSHPGWVQCVRLTPDNQFLVSAGPAPRRQVLYCRLAIMDGQLAVYGVAERDAGPIHSIAITADGKKLVIGARAATRQAGWRGRDSQATAVMRGQESR